MDPGLALAAGAATGLLFVAAGIAPKVIWRHLRPSVITGVVAGIAQSFTLGPEHAAVLAAQILVSFALATLVTLTTSTTELLDEIGAWCQPSRRIGIQPARVALALTLAMRSVPIVASLGAEIRDARRARGARPSAVSLTVPLLVQTLQHAEQLGEGLIARGVDD